MQRNIILPLLALALAGGSLKAGDGLSFGLQAGLSQANGDLKSSAGSRGTALGGGLNLTYDLGEGHLLRPRMDYTRYKRSPDQPLYDEEDGSLVGTGSVQLSNLSAGLDYLYFIKGKAEGFYLTGGLSANRWKANATASNDVASASASSTTTRFGFAAGVGYQVNNWVGMETRFTSTQFGKRSHSANGVQMGVTVRF